jgi:hypothetical protein
MLEMVLEFVADFLLEGIAYLFSSTITKMIDLIRDMWSML